MRNIPTHWLFISLILVFILLAIFSSLPIPILVAMLLMVWCALAVLVLIVQRMLSNRAKTKTKG